MAPRVRLFVEHPLSEGARVPLDRAQAHYLFNVMRLGEGAEIAVFDGRAGEWAAQVVEAGKRGGALECRRCTAPQGDPPDVWLVFAPVKKARTDFIVEKAVEMGARRIVPVQTDHTNAERIRRDRL
ncbi:RsmE family RNA methyltransferase, partial [Rhodosalinus sp.]|uniref:RsmE family RNA methyltransferase n=1 Tax=Rhodosalinus sp. TaxID=2047741 RepID=UPI003563EF6E